MSDLFETLLYNEPAEEPDVLEMEETDEDSKTKRERSIILYNDEVNSFMDVISALMEVCEHPVEQAEQCTWIAHYKGKCDVKHGSYEKLKPLATSLLDRNLTVEIE